MDGIALFVEHNAISSFRFENRLCRVVAVASVGLRFAQPPGTDERTSNKWRKGDKMKEKDYRVKCDFPDCEEKIGVSDETQFWIEGQMFVFCMEHSFQAAERGFKNWAREEKEE